MIKAFFAIIICLLFFITCQSQSSDILILKKHNRTFQTYFPGSEVNFYTSSRPYYNDYITSINHDSLFLVQYDVRQIPTTLGIYMLDTINRYYFSLNYKDIIGFGKDREKKFDWGGSGGALVGGGSVIAIVGLGTWIFTKPGTEYYASPYLVGGAALLAGIGYLIAKASAKGIRLGKKYTLEYVGVK